MKVLIVYATHTGSTMYVARELQEVLASQHKVVLKTAADASIDDLQAAEAILVGSSSWDWQGNRGYPLAEMMAFLDRVEGFDYLGKKMALFGCGDRDFEHFCGALDVIGKRLAMSRAEFMVEPLRLNQYFMDEFGNQNLVKQWAQAVLQNIT